MSWYIWEAPAIHSLQSACRHPQWRRDRCVHRWWCRCHRRKPESQQALQKVLQEFRFGRIDLFCSFGGLCSLLLPGNNQLSQAQVASICASFVRNALLHASITCKNLWQGFGCARWYSNAIVTSKSIGQVQVGHRRFVQPLQSEKYTPSLGWTFERKNDSTFVTTQCGNVWIYLVKTHAL